MSYWAEAMASDGFVIECIRGPEGERFGIISREPSKFAGLYRIPPDSIAGGTSNPIKNCWVRCHVKFARLLVVLGHERWKARRRAHHSRSKFLVEGIEGEVVNQSLNALSLSAARRTWRISQPAGGLPPEAHAECQA
jgi:hypothetical protein